MFRAANLNLTLRRPFYHFAVTDRRSGEFLREFFSTSCDHYGLWYVEKQFDPETENVTQSNISDACCFNGDTMTIVWASPFGPALPYGRGQEKVTDTLTEKLLPRPDIVNGPGHYRMRNGRIARIAKIKDASAPNKDHCEGEYPARQKKNGTWVYEWWVWGPDGRAIAIDKSPRDLLEKLSD